MFLLVSVLRASFSLPLFREVLGSPQTWEAGAESSRTPLPAHKHGRPRYQQCSPERRVSYQGWAPSGTSPPPKVRSLRAHSRRCGGCGSGHPCDDSSPSLSFPMGFFLCPKNPPLCPPPSLSFQVCVLVSLTHFSKFSAIISLHISSAHSFSLGFPSGIPITHPSECSISSQSSRYSVSFSVSLFCSVWGIFRAVFERGDAFLGRVVPLVSPLETSFLSFCASNVSIWFLLGIFLSLLK